jgi:hypothetical protein
MSNLKAGTLVFNDTMHNFSTTNKMHLLSQIIYSCKTLYMIWTVFPSTIRSSKLRIQPQYMSISFCYLLLSCVMVRMMDGKTVRNT